LHVSPESCLAYRFKKDYDYISVNLNADKSMIAMDITAISFQDDTFDAIVCNHVLEHINDDLRAIRELFRVLKPGGWASLLVPIKGEITQENLALTDPKERLRLYGQEDHVRCYGRDFFDRLRFAGFEVAIIEKSEFLLHDDQKRISIDSENEVVLCRKIGVMQNKPNVSKIQLEQSKFTREAVRTEVKYELNQYNKTNREFPLDSKIESVIHTEGKFGTASIKNSDDLQKKSCIDQKGDLSERLKTVISKARTGENYFKPLVSVIVPTNNRSNMLRRAIESILNQTFRYFEIIVVNDAEQSVEEDLKNIFQSNKVSYIRHPFNGGLAASRNTGIRLARGKYIAYLDADDLFYENHLERLVDFLESSEYKVAYTDAYCAHQVQQSGQHIVSKRDLPYSFDFDHDRIVCSNFIPVLCFMHEKSCLDAVGGFDESLSRHEDRDLWIRMSRKYEFAHIKQITCEFSWREDGTSMTSGSRPEFRQTYEAICDKYQEITKGKPSVLKVQKIIRLQFYYKEALSLLRQNNKTDAVRALEKCLDIDCANPDVLDLLRQLQYQKPDPVMTINYQDSEEKSRRGLTIDTLIRQGRKLFGHGDLKAAADCFRAVIDMDPLNLDSITNLGDISWQANMIESALFFFKRGAELDPSNDALKDKISRCENRVRQQDDTLATKGESIAAA